MVGLVAGLGFGVGLGNLAAGCVVGALFGTLAGLIGWTAGRSAASRMRLAAQTALCQVAIEKHLARAGDLAAADGGAKPAA
jgi:hypothetical protein